MGRVRVGAVVIDCNDLDGMLAFWREALGYVDRYEVEHDWASLRDPADPNVNVSLQVVPEPRVGKNRLHLDLYTDDQAGEVERLLGIGATLHPRTPDPDDDFIVLADPEGNLFCVIQLPGEALSELPYMISSVSWTLTLPPPASTGEPFASTVASSSEPAVRIV